MSAPARLYHGTSAEHAEAILRDGLLPRQATGKSNWDHTFSSLPDRVYLTTAYALHFAKCAAKGGGMAVVEVDGAGLTESRLFPDEDFVAQGLAKRRGMALEKAQKAAIRDIKEWQHVWQDSMRHMGTVAHRGAIPAARVLRVAVIDPELQCDTMKFVDPTITPANYMFKGDYYRKLTEWFLGDRDLLPEVGETEKIKKAVGDDPAWGNLTEKIEFLRAWSLRRDGIRVLQGGGR